jgi:hypothetical protein
LKILSDLIYFMLKLLKRVWPQWARRRSWTEWTLDPSKPPIYPHRRCLFMLAPVPGASRTILVLPCLYTTASSFLECMAWTATSDIQIPVMQALLCSTAARLDRVPIEESHAGIIALRESRICCRHCQRVFFVFFFQSVSRRLQLVARNTSIVVWNSVPLNPGFRYGIPSLDWTIFPA